jgi:hypothetical protein
MHGEEQEMFSLRMPATPPQIFFFSLSFLIRRGRRKEGPAGAGPLAGSVGGDDVCCGGVVVAGAGWGLCG